MTIELVAMVRYTFLFEHVMVSILTIQCTSHDLFLFMHTQHRYVIRHIILSVHRPLLPRHPKTIQVIRRSLTVPVTVALQSYTCESTSGCNIAVLFMTEGQISEGPGSSFPPLKLSLLQVFSSSLSHSRSL